MSKTRTLLQNKSLHLWLTMLSNKLNESGLTIEKTLTGKAEILWSMTTVKEILFKQIMKAQTGKENTSKLTTKELGLVTETLVKYLAEQHDLVVDWPSMEQMSMNSLIKNER